MFASLPTIEGILERVHLLSWLAGLVVAAATGWFTYYDRLPQLIVSILAGIGALTVLVLTIIAFRKLMSRYPKAFCLVVPYSKAVTDLYGMTKNSFCTREVSARDISPSEKLEHMGNMILAIRSKVPIRIYAKKAPSPIAEWLTEDEIECLHLEHGSDNLSINPGSGADYTEAMVHRFDLYRYAAGMIRG
jgi:hypothetical protein